jgi:hypothetical protein
MQHGRSAATSIAGILIMVAGVARGQTLSNPDLSAIGDMRVIARTSETADSLGQEPLEFSFEELEIAINAYLNPYMRADVFVGIHGLGPEIEIEEAVLTVLRGLPLSLQMSAGAYLLDFGRINSQHPHQWGWLERPLMQQTMFGEEGLRAVGLRATTLLAVGETAVTLSGSAFNGDAFSGHEHGDEAAAHEHEEAAPKIMGSGRLSAFRQFGTAWSFEIGGSYLGGIYDPVENLNVNVAGIDAKLRWRPDTYRSLVWIAEAMSSDRDVEPDSTGTLAAVDAMGAFTSAEYQWRRRWSAGAFFDWTEDATVAGAETTATGGFLAFSPAEETARFSLVYRHETSDLYAFTDDSLTLQFLWSLGPHKPHAF